MLVPGMGFDIRGNRCGHGKGYYDKLLAHAGRRAPLIGIAFDCQVFPEIPTEPHDVKMAYGNSAKFAPRPAPSTATPTVSLAAAWTEFP